MKEPEPGTGPIDPESVAAVPQVVGNGEIVDVVARALEVFADRTALRWLRTSIPSLGNSTPQEMLEREGGIEQVEDFQRFSFSEPEPFTFPDRFKRRL